MTPTRTCPRCGKVSPIVRSYCPACGESLKSSGGGHAWKPLVGALLLFAGIIWASALYNQTRESFTQPQQLIGAGTSPTPTIQLDVLTSAQHLAAAKRALAEGYRPHKDTKKASWGEVATAKRHLKEIGPDAAEYHKAQGLLKEVARRERQIELASKEKARPAPALIPEGDGDDEGTPSSAPDAPAQPSTGERTAAGGKGKRAGSESSSDDYYTNVEGVRVRRPVIIEGGPPPGASAQCRDGSYSFSRNRRGTCSHHGGVARWF